MNLLCVEWDVKPYTLTHSPHLAGTKLYCLVIRGRHTGVSSLPKATRQWCPSQYSNPQPMNRKSVTLSIAQLLLTGQQWKMRVVTEEEEICHIVANILLHQLIIVDVVFAGGVGQVWHQCTIDVAHSSVCGRSTRCVSASVTARNNQCTSTATHVCHASSVDRICQLRHAVSWPSIGTLCLCYCNAGLPQPGTAGATLWAWTVLQKVGVSLCHHFM